MTDPIFDAQPGNKLPADPTLKELVEYVKAEHNGQFSVEDFTCYNCKGWRDCEFQFDLYNTHGDCLMEK